MSSRFRTHKLLGAHVEDKSEAADWVTIGDLDDFASFIWSFNASERLDLLVLNRDGA